jgi:hypothetical protein
VLILEQRQRMNAWTSKSTTTRSKSGPFARKNAQAQLTSCPQGTALNPALILLRVAELCAPSSHDSIIDPLVPPRRAWI